MTVVSYVLLRLQRLVKTMLTEEWHVRLKVNSNLKKAKAANPNLNTVAQPLSLNIDKCIKAVSSAQG